MSIYQASQGINSGNFLISISGVQDITDELGVWEIDAEESFAAPGDEQVSHWQIDLPSDPKIALQDLARQEFRLKRSKLALPHAQKRLESFVQQGGISTPAQSFSQPDFQRTISRPELELGDWIYNTQEVSFALPSALPDEMQQAARAASAFFEKIQHLVRYFAWIETSSAGQRQAMTIVSWTGDFQTAWGSGRNQLLSAEHARSLELALGTRTAWMRMALIILRGAVQLSVLFPTNPALALPAAYKFIRQVLEQAQILQDLHTIKN